MSSAREILALSKVSGIGPKIVRQIVDIAGGEAENVFNISAEELRANGISESVISSIEREKAAAYDFANRQLAEAERRDVRVISYCDKEYPRRLRETAGAPIVLFVGGKGSLSTAKVLAVVGTRRPTDEGRIITSEIVNDLCRRHPDLIIVSGLAFGVDVVAHRAALAAGRLTTAVVAHGLDTVYPSQHLDTAKRILEQGLMVSEFPFGTLPEAYNFVSRNRIIAGMSDGCLVVESGAKGGSLITAARATEMGRRLMAIAGWPTRTQSAGCNDLIKSGAAQMIENADDIDRVMGWQTIRMKKEEVEQAARLPLMPTDPTEKAIVEVLKQEDCLSSSMIVMRTQLPASQVNASLLSMEFGGFVRSLPGNVYKLLI
ncbi:MAG: DNA-processing protein DprA [Bacteroidales bacterium]|nr:DNA-processing protein DprA [Bacteroidales bacterium]